MAAPPPEFKPKPRWRIGASEINPVACVIAGVGALDDPRLFGTHAEWLARPAHYPEAAFSLETLIVGRDRVGDRDSVETILSDAPLSIRLFQIGRLLALIPYRGCVIPNFDAAGFIAFLKDKDTARIGVAALGFVESPTGFVALSETTFKRPGFWPYSTKPRERFALALYAVVMLRHGRTLRCALVRP